MPGWKTVTQPKPASLSEIMDEALAKKLQEEEDAKYGYASSEGKVPHEQSPCDQSKAPDVAPQESSASSIKRTAPAATAPESAPLTEDELIAKAIQVRLFLSFFFSFFLLSPLSPFLHSNCTFLSCRFCALLNQSVYPFNVGCFLLSTLRFIVFVPL